MGSGRTRVAVVKAITSPLGFYVLALLIAEATIGLVLIKSDLDAKDKFYGLLLAVGMFVLVVVVVTVLVCFQAHNLTYDRQAHLIDRGKVPYGSEDDEVGSEQLTPKPRGARGKVVRMAKVFCVSYDLNGHDSDYSGLFDVLRSMKHWWHFLNSTWLVTFDGDPDELWSRLQPHVRDSDHLLVIGVTAESAGWLPEKAWDWIEKNVDAAQTASAT